MALISAIAFGPIAYSTPTQQWFIPVPAFGFNDVTGAIEFVQPSLYPEEALVWLEQLRQWGYIRPGIKPARKPAMVIEAADPGVSGNHITITLTNSGNTFDMVVESTTSYEGVSLDDLKTLLGTETQPGTQPGLVRLRNADLTPPLAFPAETVAPVDLEDGDDASPVPASASTKNAIKSASDPGTVAFKLIARKPGSGGNKLKVTITHGQVADTINLNVTWYHEKLGVDPTAADILTTMNDEFGYLISVTAPSGQPFAAPDTGTISLAGGTDAAKASAHPVTP